jgi:hypothetical protein
VTTDLSTRTDLLNALEASHQALRSAVTGLDDAYMTAPIDSDWSAREILAHLTGWDELAARDFTRVARGQMPILAAYRHEDVDAWNEAHVRGRNLFPPAQTLAEFDSAWAEAWASLQALPEAMFAEGQLARAFSDITIQHKSGHAEQIRQWRQAQGV